MSDIAILSDPLSIAFLSAVFGSPGFVVGGILGALAWHGQRIWGAALGAAAGFVLCVAGWWAYIVS